MAKQRSDVSFARAAMPAALAAATGIAGQATQMFEPGTREFSAFTRVREAVHAAHVQLLAPIYFLEHPGAAKTIRSKARGGNGTNGSNSGTGVSSAIHPREG